MSGASTCRPRCRAATRSRASSCRKRRWCASRCDDGCAGRRLQLHHRHGRLVGHRAAARPPRAAPDRPRPGVHRSDLARPAVRHARHQRRRDHEPGAGGDRHRAVGLALQARRPAAVEGGRRREATHAGVHDRRRLAAPRHRRRSCARPCAAKEAGFQGAKIKVGLPRVADDVARLRAVRKAVGDGFEIMVDANQCFTLSEALRRAPAYADLGIAWFEEPLPADDIAGHARLAASTRGADRGRRIALLAEPVRGLHPAGRVFDRAGRRGAHRRHHAVAEGRAPGRVPQPRRRAALPDGAARQSHRGGPTARWVEYIPQLDAVAESRVLIEAGDAVAPDAPGLGIDWRWGEIERRTRRALTPLSN